MVFLPDKKTEFSGHLVSELDGNGKFWLKLSGQNKPEQDAIARLSLVIELVSVCFWYDTINFQIHPLELTYDGR